MKNGLSYFQTGGEAEAPESAVAPTKLPAAGKAPLDPTQTADLLANMQAMIEARQSPMSQLNRGLERAAAWGSGGIQGPSAALNQLNQQEQAEQKSTFDMRQQMAAFRTAQAQQEAFERRKAAELGGAPGAASGAFGEATMPPQIRTALNNARTQEDYNKIYNAWAQKQAEIYAAPGMDEPKIPVVDMVDGRPVLKTISTREYRANPGRYQDTPQTQAAVQSVVSPAPAPAGAPGAPRAPVSVRNNNPGNLVDPATGKIRTFATPAEGEKALEADLQLKLSGQSPAVKQRFGDQVGSFMSPALLAETWAPSTAPGNTPESTANYGKAIARALGIDPTSQIPNTPEALAKAKAEITKFEAGNYMPPATAPAAPAAAQQAPIQQPRPTPGQLQRQQELDIAAQKEFGTNVEKGNAAKAQKIDDAGLSAPERVARFNDIINITQDPEMKDLFGKLAKKGFAPFVLRQLEEGVNAGQFGTLGIAKLERNLMQADATPSQIEKMLRVEKHLAKAELEYAQMYLTGQGAVSDNERRLVKDAVGNIKDPFQVMQMQARVMAQRAEFDQKIKEAYDAYRDRNGDYASFGAFMRSDAKGIVNEHNQKLASIIGKSPSLLTDPISAKGMSSGNYTPGSIKWGTPKK